MTKRENTVFSRIFAHLKIWCLRFSQLLYPFSIFRKTQNQKKHFFFKGCSHVTKSWYFYVFFFQKTEFEKGYPFPTDLYFSHREAKFRLSEFSHREVTDANFRIWQNVDAKIRITLMWKTSNPLILTPLTLHYPRNGY